MPRSKNSESVVPLVLTPAKCVRLSPQPGPCDGPDGAASHRPLGGEDPNTAACLKFGVQDPLGCPCINVQPSPKTMYSPLNNRQLRGDH
eukprot:scaffold60459_cov31-Tisochrysis_lutea.AAC.7